MLKKAIFYMIIDTHCHLDDEKFNEDLNEILASAKEEGIKNIVIPGADIKDLQKSAIIANNHENIYFAIGVHPDYINDYDEEYLLSFANNDKCIAVGECGLDYFRLPEDEIASYKQNQINGFKKQIELSIKLNKALIIHSREANQDTYEILNSYGDKIRGVIHCYNASPLLLELKENFYFGIGGVLTFKNAKALTSILPQIPLDRIVIETDAPYLTPHPHRGERNEPKYTNLVAEKIAQILNLSKEEVEEITTHNAKKLYGI